MACHKYNATDHLARECPNNQTEEVTLFQNSTNQDQEHNMPDRMKKFTSDNFGLAVMDSGCNITYVSGKPQ